MAAIPDMAQDLPLGCELLVVAYRPGSSDFDLALQSPDSNLGDAVSTLRRRGLSIDGDNAYKRDLCDVIAGAMTLGYKNSNEPPEGHWAKRFWDIGRAEDAAREELREVLQGVTKRCSGQGYVGVDGQYLKTINAVLAKYQPLNPA